MANNDPSKKRSVAIDLDTYERLSKLAAQLRLQKPGGGMVSLSAAVARLLDNNEILQRLITTMELDGTIEPVSLHDYAANAEKNDRKYLEPENETE